MLPVPTDDTIARIDALAEAWHAQPKDRDRQADLWREVFALDAWFFLPRGADESPQPYAIQLEQGPAVLAFTTPDRARTAAIANGIPEAEAQKILAVPLPQAIEWLASLSSTGIRLAAFDYTITGYFALLSNLVPMREWLAANI